MNEDRRPGKLDRTPGPWQSAGDGRRSGANVDEGMRSDPTVGRRAVLGLLGAVGLTAVAGCGGDGSGSGAAGPTPTPMPLPTPTPDELGCVLSPEQTEGPYFLDERLDRSDIRTDVATGIRSSGHRLRLRLHVYAIAAACTPLRGAVVDVWHADAQGRYSGFAGAEGKTYLRGYQTVDERGLVEFVTVFPGWYPGRTIHIHFKVRFFDEVGGVTWERTSQLYFRDAFADFLLDADPYDARGPRDTHNADDLIFADGGSELILGSETPNELEGGYIMSYRVGIATP